jgi:tripartite ATP-independent transporter DctM subunit
MTFARSIDPTVTASQPARVAQVAIVFENAVLTCVFVAAVVLPLAEIVLRATLRVGIEGVGTLVQHATLALGMLGAAIAAREGRLLTLSVAGLLAGRHATVARFASGVIAAAICGLLLLAAIEFVGVERTTGNRLVYGLPVWIAELPLPIGFALIAVRLAYRAADTAAGRAAAATCAIAIIIASKLALFAAATIVFPVLVALGIAAVLGAPIFAVLGGAALVLLQAQGVPSAAMAVNHYSLVINPSLPAIPMFTLAGYLLAESGAPRRLVEVFDAFFGRFRGGAAIVTVLACAFFTAFTGASGVTILALGGLVLPLLTNAGYRSGPALGLITAAGLPGVILMPALPLLLFAIVARVGIEDMFIGGLLPALLMLVIIAAWGSLRQPPGRVRITPFSWERARTALWRAKWELSLPVVPIFALASGMATAVEAAAVTALYALVIVTVIHRDLGLVRDLPRVVCECGLLIGGILLVLGVALSFTNYLVDAEVPARLVTWVTQTIDSPWVFLLALNVVLLAAGCVMDIYTAIMVLVPLLMPLGLAFGIHPVHLGIIFLANLEIGYLTPPVGMNLFFASYRFGRPVIEIFRAVAPLFLWLGAALLAITYLPWLSTGLIAMKS